MYQNQNETDQHQQLAFRKSSYSATQNDCVEVADLPAGAAVRDTQHRELGHITIASSTEWTAFLSTAKHASL
ncbi:DUF397 domain-containing protein [Nocardiopsis sp. YSL2]|uniref:DUF397 domain-containing protein n=1 Tax=Nocardiopsis sp. YSL2 TaxID=2939492 RepID=UPI0026F45ECA|nr:DUF397 domain-containing protein [Nocardiopsis sp. YSL2]